jgi:hypothetical protein
MPRKASLFTSPFPTAPSVLDGLPALLKQEAIDEKSFTKLFVPNPGGQERFFDLIGRFSDPAPPAIDHRFVYLCGGVGAGKTLCGSAFITIRAIFDPKARSLITANTYGQLETSTIPGFVEFCDRHGVEIYPRRETVEETAKAITFRRLCRITVKIGDRTYKASIMVLSAEAFTARTTKAKTPGAGLQVRSIWADEFTTAEKSAFDVLNDRLGRGEGTIKGLGVITSTINKYNPYNWTYELFDDPDRDEIKQKLFKSIVVKTKENIALDADFYESVAAGLTPEHIRIQLEGEYVGVTEGRLISTFDRKFHVKTTDAPVLDLGKGLHLTLDFNRSPATASMYQIEDHKILGMMEWYQMDSDTFRLSQSIVNWIRSVNFGGTVFLYGDATGGQKTANSKQTNWQIVKNTLAEANISYNHRVRAANPSVVDSVNGLKFKVGKNEVILNGYTQKELIKDMESVVWKDGEIDKTNILRTHLLDGLRYLCWYLYPYETPRYSSVNNGVNWS